jgi:predicted RNase H-like nuclease (RuvC/YqgF family)|tara:strand:+ start:771 stop:1094 length:324 start_codon:yes stop_codon:yes gene_type:complete
MMDFLAVYSEAGMIGVVGAMFVYMVYSMNKRATEQAQALENLKIENKGQSETLENMEGMVIKLINRWNQSDDKLDRKFDAITKEINDLDNQVSEIKGSLSRVNGQRG